MRTGILECNANAIPGNRAIRIIPKMGILFTVKRLKWMVRPAVNIFWHCHTLLSDSLTEVTTDRISCPYHSKAYQRRSLITV